MNRICIKGILAFGMACVFANAVQAQQPLPPGGNRYYPPPPVSPYLNLLRSNSSAAINYYGVVRPELDTRAAFQAIDQQFADVNAALPFQAPGNLVQPTGHPVYFDNLSHYYPGFRAPNRGAAANVATPYTGSTIGTTPITSSRIGR